MVGDDEVEVAVAIHVGDRDVVRQMAGENGRGFARNEISAPVAEQDGQRAAFGVSDDEVGFVVVIQIGDGNKSGAFAGRDRFLVEGGQLVCFSFASLCPDEFETSGAKPHRISLGKHHAARKASRCRLRIALPNEYEFRRGACDAAGSATHRGKKEPRGALHAGTPLGELSVYLQ
jgi:hypothetical protein